MDTEETKQATMPVVPDTDYDTTSPDAGAVREFLDNGQPEEQVEVEQPSKEWDGKPINMTWGDTTFDTSKDADPELEEYNNMSVEVQEDTVPITDSDKETFLLATLNSELFKLDIELFGGRMKATCRDINVYERQVLMRAIDKAIASIGMANTTLTYVRTLLREYRVPMQLVAVNGKPVDGIWFTENPTEHPFDNMDADAEALIEKATKMQRSTPGAAYAMYVKALNVFELKLARLEQAALTGNFWQPAGQGS